MKPEVYFPRVKEAAALDPHPRHAALLTLYDEVLAAYCVAVQQITPARAVQMVNMGDDRRTVAQIVGHMAAWDRFSTQGAGDILAGVEHPRAVTSTAGYITASGDVRDFESVDAFNAWAAEIDSQRSWLEIQTDALQTARTFYALLLHPDLLSADRLEHTKPHHKRLGNGDVIEDIRMGWVLVLLQLEHMAISHTAELSID